MARGSAERTRRMHAGPPSWRSKDNEFHYHVITQRQKAQTASPVTKKTASPRVQVPAPLDFRVSSNRHNRDVIAKYTRICSKILLRLHTQGLFNSIQTLPFNIVFKSNKQSKNPSRWPPLGVHLRAPKQIPITLPITLITTDFRVP